MTSRRPAAGFRFGPWIGACLASPLLQIWADGLAGLALPVLGSGLGLLAASRLLSGALAGLQPPQSFLPRPLLIGLSALALWRDHAGAGWWVPFGGVGLLAADLSVGLPQRGLAPLGLEVSPGTWNPLFWLLSCAGGLV